MKTYTAEILNCTRNGDELIAVLEFERDCLTSHDFKDIILNTLFFEACQGGCDSEHLTAIVKRNGETVMVIRSDTKVDGSTIDAVITCARPREKYRHLRTMNIAS